METFVQSVSEIHRVLKGDGQALVFTRTTEDRRYGKGREIGKNTYIIDRTDTNESGMTMCFLDREDVSRIFKNFRQMNVEKTETTVYGEKDSDWIISLRK
jgi:hypothetical protein